MPKASLVLSDGTTVTIEGAAEEVAAVLERVSGLAAQGSATANRKAGRERVEGGRDRRRRAGTPGPIDNIRELLGENFFNTKRGLKEVQRELEQRAHIYPVTTLSPALFRLVKARELRRMKEDGNWKYVKP